MSEHTSYSHTVYGVVIVVWKRRIGFNKLKIQLCWEACLGPGMDGCPSDIDVCLSPPQITGSLLDGHCKTALRSKLG